MGLAAFNRMRREQAAKTKTEEPKVEEPKVEEPKVEEPKVEAIGYVSTNLTHPGYARGSKPTDPAWVKFDAELASRHTPKDHSDNGDWAVMKVGRKPALKLFKVEDHDDHKLAAQGYLDALMGKGKFKEDELFLEHRS